MARITKIERKQVGTERLYNLAVTEDESFIAGGIVVHNCKSFLVANVKERELTPGGLRPTAKDDEEMEKLLKSITLSEKEKER